MSDNHQVVTNEQRRRVLFEGTREQVREYVERHFPHVHAEPGTNYGDDGPPADAVVVAPDRAESTFVGGKWSDDKDDENDATEHDDVNPVDGEE